MIQLPEEAFPTYAEDCFEGQRTFARAGALSPADPFPFPNHPTLRLPFRHMPLRARCPSASRTRDIRHNALASAPHMGGTKPLFQFLGTRVFGRNVSEAEGSPKV